MSFNKKYIAAISILFSLALAIYIHYRYESKIIVRRTANGFIIESTPAEPTGFCTDNEIKSIRENYHIITLRLCENDIIEIILIKDLLSIQTGCGVYQKNLETGEEKLFESSCLGRINKIR